MTAKPGPENGFEVRLARTPDEVRAAQRLRFRVFYREMGASPEPGMADSGLDHDGFDRFCDHLLVIDHAADGGPRIAGTYRLLRGEVARRHEGFYSAGEFDLGPLAAFPGEVLELGRSCVDSAYRSRAAMQLLWQGIAAYVLERDIGLMFGCASLPGTDPAAMARPLAYLYHEHLAPEEWRPRALAGCRAPMDVLPRERIDRAAAWRELPPLIRGYLRLGGRVGDGAAIDRRFGTTDVCLVLETGGVTARYRRHYEAGLAAGVAA